MTGHSRCALADTSAALRHDDGRPGASTNGEHPADKGATGGQFSERRSHFHDNQLEAVVTAGTIPPAVDQVQFSPRRFRRALLDACWRRNVAAEAYSPLGTGRNLSDATVDRVAQRVGRTPAQVLLRWCLQRGLPVITKSTRRDRIHENAQIFDFTLSEPDIVELDALDQTNGTDRALERKWW